MRVLMRANAYSDGSRQTRKPWSLAEVSEHSRIFTTDSDFYIYR